MSRASLLAVLVVLSACHGTSTTPRRGSDPHSLLAAVARGEQSLWSLADASAGIAYARFTEDASGEDPRADAEGNVREAERICDAASLAADAVTRELALHFTPELEHVPLGCDGLVCYARGGSEFASSLRFVFAEDVRARVVLRTVLVVEEVAVAEAIATERWADVEQAAAAIPPSCP